MNAVTKQQFNVGGVMLERPFRVTRLGHFGFYTNHMEAAKRFYIDWLGFRISDPLDFSAVRPDMKGMTDATGYFMRHNGDHHSFVLFPRHIFEARAGLEPDQTVNQITWQLGSLQQVVNAAGWLAEEGSKIDRTGRDMPGSNWHVYMRDPEGSRNELYYGMEQIGWDGRSKPFPMRDRRFTKTADLPQVSEYHEVNDAAAAGVDLLSGYRNAEAPETYVAGGVKLARPFRITSLGPVRLLADDVDAVVNFYHRTLGFEITEEVVWRGHRCVYLRCNTDHHCLSVFPRAIARELGMTNTSKCFAFGVRLHDYEQLRAAVAFLQERGVEVRKLPAELFPGMDYTAFAVDPDGHMIQLYCYMEQIGWEGKPRPAALRRRVDNENWPDAIEPMSDSFNGEVFLGPWG